jgi:hypothetical protein
MTSTGPPRTMDDVIPPVASETIHRVGMIGLACCAIAAGLALLVAVVPMATAWLATPRLLLTAIGLVVSGSAISLRPALWSAWAIGCMAAALAVAGIPGHWDSARLLITVMAVVAAIAAGLAALPPTPRYSLLSLAALFHFGGILTATTWPDPTPWLTNQVAYRIYMPYLTFMYLRNAYHFYSPEPGPASHLFVLLKYELDEIDPETGTTKIVHEWITLPRRDEHMKDPLGQSYYRRLSITEMASQSIPGLVTGENFENLDARMRRTQASVTGTGGTPEPIPIRADVDPPTLQYRIPQPHITRYLLPSYSKHLAVSNTAPGRKVLGMKIYRVEHRIPPPQVFKDGFSPYHPTTYRPYFCGDFDANGKLLDPQDPMLYWLVPIAPRPEGPDPNDPLKRDYIDYLSKHAGYEFDWGRIRP